jgi:hypothetical protein
LKYADDAVLLATEEMVLQGMIDRLTEIGRCYGMEMNVEEEALDRTLWRTFFGRDYGPVIRHTKKL